MTDTTDIDRALAARDAAPEDTALNLTFHERVAEAEIYLVLEEEPEGETARARILDTSTGPLALAFDREERMAAFMGEITPYVALSGRQVAAMLAGSGTGLALNLGTEAETVLPADALAWMADTLANTAASAQGQIVEVTRPGTLPEALLAALDRKLALLAGAADTALLGGVVYADGTRSHALAVIGAVPEAEPGIAAALGEALRLSGLEAGALDVVFLAADHAVTAALARHGLRFDLPEIETPEPQAPSALGTDPDKPPRLR